LNNINSINIEKNFRWSVSNKLFFCRRPYRDLKTAAIEDAVFFYNKCFKYFVPDSQPIVNETEEIFRMQEVPILDMLSHRPKGTLLGLAQTAFVQGVSPIEETSIFTSTVLQAESTAQDTGYASEDFSCPKVASSRQGKDGYSSTPTKETS
jgi:hypothetical protein